MFNAIANCISGIAGAIAAVFKWKSTPARQRRDAEEDVRAEAKRVEDKKNEIRQAVYEFEDDKLTRMAQELLAPCAIALLAATVLFACASISGCVLQPNGVVYVPTDRRIESCTNSLGIACKAVPDAVMEEMLIRLQSYRDLLTEKAVDKRLGQ